MTCPEQAKTSKLFSGNSMGDDVMEPIPQGADDSAKTIGVYLTLLDRPDPRTYRPEETDLPEILKRGWEIKLNKLQTVGGL
jgi:hypothetical protein